MTSPNPDFQLSDSDLAKAHNQGFLVIPDVCPENELSRLEDDYDRLFAEERG
jgi:hypothetical protein